MASDTAMSQRAEGLGLPPNCPGNVAPRVPGASGELDLDKSARGGVMQTRWELGCGEGGHIAGDATRSQRAEGLGVPPNCPGNAVPGPSPECGVRRGVPRGLGGAPLEGGWVSRLLLALW